MKAIEIIMIPVTDQQKSKDFYLKLGFEVIIEAPAAQDRHGFKWDYQIKQPQFHWLHFMALFAKRMILRKV
jgi:predicted lactoylglutathione lyase